jgi:hypothetical protein
MVQAVWMMAKASLMGVRVVVSLRRWSWESTGLGEVTV